MEVKIRLIAPGLFPLLPWTRWRGVFCLGWKVSEALLDLAIAHFELLLMNIVEG